MTAAYRYLSTLFAGYPDDTRLHLEIRPLLSEWRKIEMEESAVQTIHSQVRCWYALSEQGIQSATNYALNMASAFDVYVGVLPRLGRTGRQADILYATCLFCDVDGGNEGFEGAIARCVSAKLPAPHLAVLSGGGVHCYWALSEPVEMPDQEARNRFKNVLKRLCLAIGGASPGAHADPSAAEVARILRVPGTWNHKRVEPRPVQLMRCAPDVERLPYERWTLDLLPPLPVAPPSAYVRPSLGYTPGGFLSDGMQRWAERGYPEGKRHHDLAGAAAWLVREKGLSKADALELLRRKAQHSPGRRPIKDSELEKMILWT